MSRKLNLTEIYRRAQSKAPSNALTRLRAAMKSKRTPLCDPLETLKIDAAQFLDPKLRAYLIRTLGVHEFCMAVARLEGAMTYARQSEAFKKAE